MERSGNMSYQLDRKMVIGVSSRALFDLTRENEIFEEQGLEAYCSYQVEHEQDILRPGPGFGLIRSLLRLNEYSQEHNPFRAGERGLVGSVSGGLPHGSLPVSL